MYNMIKRDYHCMKLKINNYMKILMSLIMVLTLSTQIGFAQDSDFVQDFAKYFENGKREMTLRNLRMYLEYLDHEKQNIDMNLQTTSASLYTENLDTVTLKNAIPDITRKLLEMNSKPIRYSDASETYKSYYKRYMDIVAPSEGSFENDTIRFDRMLATFKDKLSSIRSIHNSIVLMNLKSRHINDEITKATSEVDRIFSSEREVSSLTSLISGIFILILTVLLAGFFGLLLFKSDTTIARDFLSGSGLQFMALFALILCIAMFGVLKIIDGKELATMLSGIAGFILGKGYPERNTKSLTGNLSITIANYTDFKNINLLVNKKSYGFIENGVIRVSSLPTGIAQIEFKGTYEGDTFITKSMTQEIKEGENSIQVTLKN